MKLKSLVALALFVSLSVLEASPRDLKAGAKISKNEAEHIALKHFPYGQVTFAKLEKMDARLVWWIEVASPNAKETVPVKVDAVSGRILSIGKGKR